MSQIRKAGWSLWPVLSLLVMTVPASGQDAVPAPSTDAADRLAANLVILSQNPRDVNALTEAGLSAIAVGDGNAALGFLARAEQIAPSNGRIKAALGSALILLEKPGDALKLFGEAQSLGYPEHSFAGDRGLAHDLKGDTRRAQRDYALALKNGPNDEVTRRFALSLGISGDRDRALELLDPLLRKRDLEAWRARAFILAMTGNLKDAEEVAASIMPLGAAASMSPFLRRLASLNPADRALAVNMGVMPSDGQRYASLGEGSGSPVLPASSSAALIPAGPPLGPRAEDQVSKPAEPVSREPRRRPGREAVTLASAAPVSDRRAAPETSRAAPAATPQVSAPRASGGRINNRIGPVDPSRYPPEVRAALALPESGSPASSVSQSNAAFGSRTVDASPTVRLAGLNALPPPSAGQAVASTPAPQPASDLPPPPMFEVPASVAQASLASSPAQSLSTPPAASAVGSQTPSAMAAMEASPVPVALSPAAPLPSLAPATGTANSPHEALASAPTAAPAPVSLAAIIASIQPETESAAGPLPDEARLRAARLAAQRKAAAEAKAAEAAKLEKERKEAEAAIAARHPARLWVQIATGANEAGLPLTWKRLREKAPDALKGLQASSVPFKATNRLLVGPFKTQADARKVVNALSKAGISVFTFTSEAGQEIAKIAAR